MWRDAPNIYPGVVKMCQSYAAVTCDQDANESALQR